MIVAGLAVVATVGGLFTGAWVLDDRYPRRLEFKQLVGAVSDLRRNIAIDRLESRVDKLRDKQFRYLDKYGIKWCDKIPTECKELADEIDDKRREIEALRKVK